MALGTIDRLEISCPTSVYDRLRIRQVKRLCDAFAMIGDVERLRIKVAHLENRRLNRKLN